MLAAVIKNKLQISEVIITIMLNYVALYLVEYLVNNPFKSEGMVVRTEEIQDSARLVSLVAHTRLNTGIFIALLAVFLFWVLFYKTKLGYEMRATAHLPRNQPASTTRKTCWQPCSFPAPWQALAAPAKLWAYKVITYPA